MSRSKYKSDKAPRCNVCRIVITSGNRCDAHKTPARRGGGPRDYSAFFALPVPAGGATCAEIASAIGITAERVRQIEARALRKLMGNAQALKLFRGE